MKKEIPELLDISNIEGIVIENEPMWRHSTLGIGGRADFYAIPANKNDLKKILAVAQSVNMEVFILGGGSNILVSDRGIRGLVMDMRMFNTYQIEKNRLILGAGLDISDAAWFAGSLGYSGLEFLFGMPGTVGGAVWMNARCYGKELADVLDWVECINAEGHIQRLCVNRNEWSYKVSPFQSGKQVIFRCGFHIEADNAVTLRQRMLENRNDRESKGHYRAPCAGSAFKNNRSFGDPSGIIIEQCGLKGCTVGRVGMSEWHANIMVNLGGALATDARTLLNNVVVKVEEQRGFRLEPEVVYVGEWLK